MKAALITVYFDKTTVDEFDFTISGGRDTIYGDSSILIETVLKAANWQRIWILVTKLSI